MHERIQEYPLLEIDLSKIYRNTKKVVEKCNSIGVSVTAVTKCVGGMREVAETLVQAGAAAIADSRIDNLKELDSLDVPKWLIRIPMISEAKSVVKFSDISLNSEVRVLKALNDAAKEQHKIHRVILMIDLGDLREGWFDLNQFYKECETIREFKNIKVVGIGTNSNCAGAVIPEPETFRNFPTLIDFIKNEFDISTPIVSGGNSGAYYMVEDKTLPSYINNLRLGELLLFGNETSFQTKYNYLDQNALTLKAEIIELKEKPSLPIGRHNKDAFGNEPVFTDNGIRKRAILGIGKQDIPPEDLYPKDRVLKIITASSDHLIIDVTDSDNDYQVGDVISFNCTYSSGLRASTSSYVRKKLLY